MNKEGRHRIISTEGKKEKKKNTNKKNKNIVTLSLKKHLKPLEKDSFSEIPLYNHHFWPKKSTKF